MVAELVEPHPLVMCVRELHRVMDQMPAEAWDGLDATTVRGLVSDLSRLQSRAQAHQLRGAARLEASGAAKAAGRASTGDLLAGDFGGDRGSAERLVRTSRQVSPESATRRELEAGRVSLGQAEVIGKALGGVPADKQRIAEKSLLRDAKKLNLKDLRRRADRVSDAWADKAEVDQLENQTIEQRERRARASSKFRMWDNRNGTYSGDFTIPEAQADMLKGAVDAIGAPRREHLVDDDSAPADTVHRMGMAFADLCGLLPTDGLPSAGGAGVVLTVNLDFDTLTDGLKATTLTSGTRVSAGQTRQMACRAGIIPAVFGGKSLPLDLGRKQRLFSPAQRTAMGIRDGGCTFPGCDRPPGWCEAHHIKAWGDFGTTNLADGALLCPFHHHIVHDHGWQLRASPDDGHIEFRLPGHQHWQRNNRYRARRE